MSINKIMLHVYKADFTEALMSPDNNVRWLLDGSLERFKIGVYL